MVNLLSLFTLSLLSLSSLASATTEAQSPTEGTVPFELRQLTTDSFKLSTSSGLWLVEHYSPQCGHCREFAPTWAKIAEEKKDLEKVTGFHMAQVNCLAQGDLCNSNGVKFYPDIRLYQDGIELDPYTLSRSPGVLTEYIETISRRYAKRAPVASPVTAGVGASGVQDVKGRAGSEVVSLDKAGLEKVKQDGGFVKFFAPWCGHCKKLAPVFAELASELAGQITVAEVNCEDLPALCKSEGVLGYPQLFLFANGQKYEHTGARSLSSMSAFAKKALASGDLEYVNADNINDIAKKEEVFFIYLHSYSSSAEDLKTVMDASRSLIGSATVFQSRDPDLFKLTGVSPLSGPVLLSFKDHTPSTPLLTLAFTPTPKTLSVEKVASFLEENKLPTVVKLDSGNFGDVMKNKRGSLVVLAGLRAGDENGREKLREVATAWRKGGRKFDQGVIFAWMDGDKWGKWLSSNYGMSKSKMPQVVVADPSKYEYYDVTLELEKIEFEGASIFSTLEGVYQHFLKPRSIESWGERAMRAFGLKMQGWQDRATSHPVISLLALGAFTLTGLWAIRTCVRWDFPEVGHQKLTERLD
ncbi:thioredoxin-like protein [Mrakia frigida]|uniref:thioredoxin-like protein n=1 Tax=Mrakia frigida TaxID=29902 RepID=UPI003FCC057E